jgi:CcmD family protein
MRSKILAAALLVVVLAAAVPHGAAAQQRPATPAQGEFVPIETLPAQEQIPAARLVMTAYAVAWLAVFGYVWSIWQRLSRVEQDIAAISRRIEAGGRK